VNRETRIARVRRVEAHCTPADWPWSQANRAAIEANWAEKLARTPRMFNGRVLLLRSVDLSGDLCRADYFEADFKDFLAWRDLGYPDPSIGNGYAMAALQGADGAFVCGVMGRHTANAGRIYFPSGTPDLSDLQSDGSVDLATSVTRELTEETDLPPDVYEIAADWVVVRQWPAVAFMRPALCREPADAVAERIRAAIARQDEPELADAAVIRGPDDVDPARMPLSVQSFLRWSFGV
jgi:hypothetical protein